MIIAHVYRITFTKETPQQQRNKIKSHIMKQGTNNEVLFVKIKLHTAGNS